MTTARKHLWLWVVAFLLVAAVYGCNGHPSDHESAAPSVGESTTQRTTLSVAAAANLKFAFDRLETAFEQEFPKIDLMITYGASGHLFAHLSQQAPFDIFFSADSTYPRRLVTEKLAAEEAFFLYATGQIVLWVPRESSLDLQALGMRALLDPSVHKIAVANPRLAPYGVAAEQAMTALGVYDAAHSRLVFGENITQAAQFVETGAAEIGIVALSLALAPPMNQRGRYWRIPTNLYQPIAQAGIIPAACQHTDSARRLREFVTGPNGQAILAEFGYSAPQDLR